MNGAAWPRRLAALGAAASALLCVCGLFAAAVTPFTYSLEPVASGEGLNSAYECARLPRHGDLPSNLRTAALWMRAYFFAIQRADAAGLTLGEFFNSLHAQATILVDRLILADCLRYLSS